MSVHYWDKQYNSAFYSPPRSLPSFGKEENILSTIPLLWLSYLKQDNSHIHQWNHDVLSLNLCVYYIIISFFIIYHSY